MNMSRNITQQRQTEIDEEVCSASSDHENTDRRQEKRNDYDE